MHLFADTIMYLSHSCEVHEDLYVLNSIQLTCNLVSVVSVAFSVNIRFGHNEGNGFAPDDCPCDYCSCSDTAHHACGHLSFTKAVVSLPKAACLYYSIHFTSLD